MKKAVSIFITFLSFSCILCDEGFIKRLAYRLELLEKRNADIEHRNLALDGNVVKLMDRNILLESEVAKQSVMLQQQARRIDNLESQDDIGREHKTNFTVNAVQTNNQKRFVVASEGPIAFTARIDSLYIDHVSTGNIVHFKHIVLNVGGGYQANTGIFVAPMSGIYMFSCSLLDHVARSDGSDGVVRAEIVQGGNTLGRIFAFASDQAHRDQGAQTVFAQVTKGEQVWVRIIQSDNEDLQLGGDQYSTFSGYLLFQM